MKHMIKMMFFRFLEEDFTIKYKERITYEEYFQQYLEGFHRVYGEKLLHPRQL